MNKNGFTKARYKYLAISSVFVGDKPARFMTNNYNNSRITVTNTVVIDDIPAFYDSLRCQVEGV